jgi:hypothetical protein
VVTHAVAIEQVQEPTSLLDFGPLLRRLRLRAGLSQNQLAREGGVDPAYVNRLERQLGPHLTLPSRRVVLGLWGSLYERRGATVDDRERLLVAAGLCPEAVLRAGGWDAYVNRIRGRVLAALRTIDETIALGDDELLPVAEPEGET